MLSYKAHSEIDLEGSDILLGDGIIDHTGFVGSYLVKQHKFSNLYNTSNVDCIVGQSFDILVCVCYLNLWRQDRLYPRPVKSRVTDRPGSFRRQHARASLRKCRP